MATKRMGQRRLLGTIVGILGGLLLAGCGGPSFDCVPTSGMVTLDGEPLKGGYRVVFTPDPSKGNDIRAACIGKVQDGRYEVVSVGVSRSERGSGAPPGWYKVSFQPADSSSNPMKERAKRKADIPSVYLSPEKSPLEVEVIANPQPGAYDLQLKSR